MRRNVVAALLAGFAAAALGTGATAGAELTAEQIVEADRCGLDLVGVQDHR